MSTDSETMRGEVACRSCGCKWGVSAQDPGTWAFPCPRCNQTASWRTQGGQAIHDEMMAFAQRVHDEHGVKIIDVHIGWLDASTLGEQKAVVDEIEMRTMSRGRREEGA